MERNSTTNNKGECCVFSTPLLDHVIVPVLIVEFILGIMSNMVTLWMFAFQTQTWKSHSIYLVHLAVSDAVVMLCLPFRADYYSRERNWVYGDVLCRIVLFMLTTCRAAGIFLLTAMAVDRYLKLIHPLFRINRLDLRYTNGICCGLWLLIFAMNVYLLTGKHFFYQGTRLHCESFTICMGFTLQQTWPDVFFVLQFIIPAGIVSYCTYSITVHLRANAINTMGRISRAVYFVMIVAIVFITCFLPSTISRIAVWILKAWYNECSHFQGVSVAFYYLICLTYFNSVLNPVLYYFSSSAISRAFHNLFCKIFGKETPDVGLQKSQTSNGNVNVATNGT